MSEKIFSESFFNLPHPSSPNISIQFRANLSPEARITDSSQWKEITFNPSSFFNSFELEDTGGAYNLKLSLYDKNYSFLEDTVVQTLFKTKLANKLINRSDKPRYQVEQEYFEFYISKENNTNLRIRFGYSDFNVGGNEQYVSTTSLANEDWRTRLNKKTVLKTPWIYFQIKDADFRITEKGLELSLEAFSIMSNYLEKAKLVETYTRFTGQPEDIIKYVCNKIKESAERNGENFDFEIVGEPPSGYLSEEGEEIIEIMLGGVPSLKPDGTFETRYKSIKRILDEICAAVKPIKFNSLGERIRLDTPDSEEEESVQIYRYSYFIEETEDKTKIFFYYQNPRDSLENQTFIRTYSWSQEGMSIVKSLELETKADFSSLSVPIVNIDEESGVITARNMRALDREENKEDEMDFTLGKADNATEIFNDISLVSTFAYRVANTGTDNVSNNLHSPETVSLKIADRIRANLNQQIVKGKLTLIGDPAYLFDQSMQPYKYLIAITVNRPNFLNKEGEFIYGGKSYLSGYYAISKITHTISVSGFQTELEIIKINSFGK
jgi:hypothetical protein